MHEPEPKISSEKMKESHFKALKAIADDPTLTQRDLSRQLNLSLGKVNYIINALAEKGYVKMSRFKNSKNKLAYMYVLTPSGIKAKMELTYQFIRRKSDEYRALIREIQELQNDTRMFKNINPDLTDSPHGRDVMPKDTEDGRQDTDE